MKMSDIASIEIAVLLAGYDVGYFDIAAIRRWADRQIEVIDEPSEALLDLAMLREPHPIDVMKLLRAVGASDQGAEAEIRIAILGLLFERKRLSLRQVVRGLFSLVIDDRASSEERSMIYYLDDGYDLAIAGTYGSLEQVERELIEFAKPYAMQLVEKVPHLFEL